MFLYHPFWGCYATTKYLKILFDIRNNCEIVRELDTIPEDLPKDKGGLTAVSAIGTGFVDDFDPESLKKMVPDFVPGFLYSPSANTLLAKTKGPL